MLSMRTALATGLIVLLACAPGSETTTTERATTTTSTPPAPATTLREQPYAIQDCSSPPVTFSALCEVYELLQRWHVDRPLDPAALAGVAVEGLSEYRSTTSEPRPRTVLCALPHEAFGSLCEELASLVNESEIAVGPAVNAAVVAMADIALDPFTYYVPPDQVGAFRENGIVGGIGVLLDARDAAGSRCARLAETCPLTIVFVLEDNPAAEAGLLPGDVIVAVDGVPVSGAGFAATATAIAGDETGSVSLSIERDGSPLEYEVSRAEISVPTVVVDQPAPGVGYLRIPDFETDIPTLVHDALVALADLSPHTIVIDLRDNPGGFIDSAVAVISEFVDGGPVLETTGPSENSTIDASEGGEATTERLVVIVNRGSASSAEIVAAALRDRRGAIIVGERSFGKDAVQIPFELRNGGELYVTVARWATPSGIDVGGGGLVPDIDLTLPIGMSNEELVSTVMDAAG